MVSLRPPRPRRPASSLLLACRYRGNAASLKVLKVCGTQSTTNGELGAKGECAVRRRKGQSNALCSPFRARAIRAAAESTERERSSAAQVRRRGSFLGARLARGSHKTYYWVSTSISTRHAVDDSQVARLAVQCTRRLLHCRVNVTQERICFGNKLPRD